jgi:hypothetical protein
MALPLAFRSLFPLGPRRRPAGRRPAPRGARVRPSVEQLEHRLCPSTTTVNIANGVKIPYSFTPGEQVQVTMNVTTSDPNPADETLDGVNLFLDSGPPLGSPGGLFLSGLVGDTRTISGTVGVSILPTHFADGTPIVPPYSLSGNIIIQTTGLGGGTDETGTVTVTSIATPPPSSSDKATFSGPTDGVAGVALSPPVTVTVDNAQGSPDTSLSGQVMTLTLNNANGATLSGNTATISGSQATFPSLTVSQPGPSYTLTATVGGTALGTSESFPIAGGALVNVGVSPLLNNVKVQNVFFGSAWESPINQADMSQLDAFQRFITSSSYMNLLTEYGVGPHGSFLGQTVFPVNTGRVVSDARIQHMLKIEINLGQVPPPGPNMLYFVYTPPGVGLNDKSVNNPEPSDFPFGYHSFFTDPLIANGKPVYYALVSCPSRGPGNIPPRDPGLNAFQTQTFTSSHELAEAATDPEPGLGWVTVADTAPSPNQVRNEIADLCDRQPPVYLGGYAVEQLWSNQAKTAGPLGGPVAPTGSSLSPP